MTTPVVLAAAQQNRYLAEAISALPGYREALDVAGQAQRMMLGSLTAPPPSGPLVSGTVSEEWVDQMIDHAAAVARAEQRRKVLLTLKLDAEGRAQGIYSANMNKMLAHLNSELTALLEQVSAVADRLGGVGTAEQAIARDAGALWKQLTTLADEYGMLRDAQRQLMTGLVDYVIAARPPAGGEDHASDLYLRNLDELWPSWRNPGQRGEGVIHIDGTPHRYEPWPTDRVQLLLWLVKSQAEAWIPTTKQLDRLREERTKRANPNPKVSLAVPIT